MNGLPFQWDKQELFSGSNGATAVRLASSDKNGVVVEMSMHDPTIRDMLPAAVWIPVHAAPTQNAKAERIGDWMVVLIGYGKPQDPLGNLMLIRFYARKGHSATRLNIVIGLVLVTLAGCGMRPDKNMMDTIRGN